MVQLFTVEMLRVPRIYNFSRCCNWKIWIDFQCLIHSLSHYLYVSFNTSSEKSVIAESSIFLWLVFQKRLYLKNLDKNVRKIIFEYPIHISDVWFLQVLP